MQSSLCLLSHRQPVPGAGEQQLDPISPNPRAVGEEVMLSLAITRFPAPPEAQAILRGEERLLCTLGSAGC